MRLILFVTSALALFLSELNSTVHAQQSKWSLALHGGAGVISKDLPDSMKQLYYEGLEEALSVGEEILSEGGSALKAVEMTVRALEDNPLFNAGRGAVYTNEGTHELDAAIMDGSTLAAGAITGVTTVKNPISLARNVMTDSRHVLFSGAGAETFADQTGVERVDNSYYDTKRRYEQWKRAQQQSNLGKENVIPDEYKYGTVGAAALDKVGKLAAATSTGGMTNKRFGRVGDVPIIGSGTFANHVAAISATGWGEQIMKNVSANTIANYMEFNDSTLEEAMDFVLTERLNPGDAGFIGVDHEGNISMQMNTVGMFRGSIDSHGNRTVMIWENE
ncbi:MAG: isoaspartyl peptidase/L-asparaginase [Balneolaceae bacterium]|nr:isoaspartyl peptidase/L-asparaginase [Balneolaceae bacterium]